MRCTVKWFDAKKGYGIISTKGGKEDYFVQIGRASCRERVSS